MTSKGVRGAIVGDAQYTMIALDLDNPEQALQLARKIVERSGRTVTVYDAQGDIVGVVKSATRQ